MVDVLGLLSQVWRSQYTQQTLDKWAPSDHDSHLDKITGSFKVGRIQQVQITFHALNSHVQCLSPKRVTSILKPL